MTAFEINIAMAEERSPSKNIFYQQFFDEGKGKVREVIRIVNEFPSEPKPYLFKPPISITLEVLNNLTDQARTNANLSGNSINHELAYLLNIWLMERT